MATKFSVGLPNSASMLRALLALAVFLVISLAPTVLAQTIDPTSPSKEYIRLGGRVIAIENHADSGFAISAQGPSTVNPGSSAQYTVTVTAQNGFNAAVALSISGLPAGVTATFSPASGTGSGSRTLTLAVANSVVPGVYMLSVNGSSSRPAVRRSTALRLSVPGSGVASVSRVQFAHTYPGNTATFASNNTAGNAIVVVASWAFAGTTTVSDSLGNTYNAVPLSTSSSGIVTVALWYALNITGGPNTVTVAGGGADLGITVFEYSGIASNAALGITSTQDGAVAGATTTPASASFTPSAGSLVMAFLADETVPQNAIMAGSGYTLVQFDGQHVEAQEENLNAVGAQTAAFNLGTASSSWIISILELKAALVGNQVAAPTFSPPPVTYNSPQSVIISSATANASIRYTLDDTEPTETHGTLYTGPISIGSTTTIKAVAFRAGLADSLVSTGTYTVTTAPSYSITVGPQSTAPVEVGTPASYAVTVTGQNGFNSSTSFSASGLPPGAAAIFNPATVTGPGSTTMTITGSTTTPTGVTAFTVNATATINGNAVPQSAGATFNVAHDPLSMTGAVPPSGASGTFTMTATGPMSGDVQLAQLNLFVSNTANPTCQIFYHPNNNTFQVAVGSAFCSTNSSSSASVNGNTLTVNFGVSFNPAVFSGTLNVAAAASNGVGQVSGAMFGSFTIPASAPTFTLSAPGTATQTAGTASNYTVNVAAQNGFSSAVNFSVSGLPGGATASFNPPSVTGAGATTMTLTLPSNVTTGSYGLTITGTSANPTITQSAPLTLTVNPQIAISGVFFTDQNATPITMPAPTGTTTINVGWNTNINANCTYGGIAANANGGTTGHFVTRSGLTNGFSDTQTIVCTDVSNSSNTASLQVIVAVQNSTIVISGLSFTNQNGTAITMPAPVGTTAINVVWNTNINANCTYGGVTANANGGTAGHFVTRSSLFNGFSDTQTIVCTDINSSTNTASLQVTVAVQNPAITISGLSFTNQNGTAITMPAPVGTTAINVVWNTTINANCTYGGVTANANGGTTGHFVTRSSLFNG
ncbi:MAG TPA: chitobiase/beta-hexosaminidase C-terminal domain-containing protein, partial [Candidatus Angelobacter sp.]|nr:chitobiase/beta-hexosaminidase C-terminal domain-containing protein [Candidatus Angelobacter sp.]